MSNAEKHKVLAEYSSPQGPRVSQVRGSLIVSSLETLREVGLFDRYLRELPLALQDEVPFVLASSWVSVDLAMGHYAACEGMNLNDEELDEIGRHVAHRIMGTFLATLVRSARKVAAPSLVPLAQYPRLWERLMIGGSCRVLHRGMKDARIESNGLPMFRYRYFRVAYTGLIRGAGSVFRSGLHARQVRASDDSLVLDVSWV